MHAWYDVPAGAVVSAAMGDFQCSFYAGLTQKSDAGEMFCKAYAVKCKTLAFSLAGCIAVYDLTDCVSYIFMVVVLNISTSAQLAFLMPDGFAPACSSDQLLTCTTVDYFPYFNGRYLAVAASLNGGNVLSGFITMLQQWTHALGNYEATHQQPAVHSACAGLDWGSG